MSRTRTACFGLLGSLLFACVAFSQAVKPQSTSPKQPPPPSDGGNAPLGKLLTGRWTYRSFVNDPNPDTPFEKLQFGLGTLIVESTADGKVTGSFDFGPDFPMTFRGNITYGNPATLRFQGKGTGKQNADWVYDYVAYVVPDWPNGVDQVPALVGSVVRTNPHSEGRAKAGVVVSFIALRASSSAKPETPLSRLMLAPSLTPGDASSRRGTSGERANDRYRSLWEDFADPHPKPVPRRDSPKPADLPAPVPEELLPPPQRKSLALRSTAAFAAPVELRSQNGKLDAELRVGYAVNRIGADPVRLRNYNGKLVGPTLRVKPGDTLRVTLWNDLPEEPTASHQINRLHEFNTTNLHTHGLHVSPSGTGDNVLISVPPQTGRHFEFVISKNHPAGTFWYHAHRHGSVAAQVSSGMSGALIVEGGMDEVPAVAAANANERVFVLQQIPYFNTCLTQGVIEEPYVDSVFGPGKWECLGRFTTVNGVQLPIVEMRPGEVGRWRLIHSGVREAIKFKLERAESPADAATKVLPLHEVAVDGLPLGKVRRRDSVTLYPGYRSDVLVQAPKETGDYLIVDEAMSPEETLTGSGKARAYLGRVRVAGAAVEMSLPSGDQVAKYRLPSLKSLPATGTQSADYGILFGPSGPTFTIDGKPYDPLVPRVLKLGDLDEWTLRTVNVSPAIGHPFHIHVNPFEVVEVAATGSVANDGKGEAFEPEWRDTLMLLPNRTYKVRTRYEDFTGDFVQHCHILDHEDSGMMQLVRIVDPKLSSNLSPHPDAPSRAQTPPVGPATVADPTLSMDRPVLLVFSQGMGCLHCREQWIRFAAEREAFEKLGVQVRFITPESDEDLRAIEKSIGAGPRLIADPECQLFKAFASYEKGPSHSLQLFDSTGRSRWVKKTDRAVTDMGAIKAEVARSLKE